MEAIIDLYKNVVVQIATPFSLGTGFYLGRYNLIVTNEHVVRGNQRVVINGQSFDEHLASVKFIDEHLDLAFLDGSQINIDHHAKIDPESEVDIGDEIIAIGHPFGLKFAFTKGIVSNPAVLRNELNFIQHDAALNPGNSGGPLVNRQGEIVGVNTFTIVQGNSIGFSLPIQQVKQNINKFIAAKRMATVGRSKEDPPVFE